MSLHRHNSGMALWKAAPEEVRLEATAEDSQRWCRRDVVRQTVPNTGSSDREARSLDSCVRRTISNGDEADRRRTRRGSLRPQSTAQRSLAMFRALSADNPEFTHFYLSDPRFAKFYSQLQMSVIPTILVGSSGRTRNPVKQKSQVVLTPFVLSIHLILN